MSATNPLTTGSASSHGPPTLYIKDRGIAVDVAAVAVFGLEDIRAALQQDRRERLGALDTLLRLKYLGPLIVGDQPLSIPTIANALNLFIKYRSSIWPNHVAH